MIKFIGIPLFLLHHDYLLPIYLFQVLKSVKILFIIVACFFSYLSKYFLLYLSEYFGNLIPHAGSKKSLGV